MSRKHRTVTIRHACGHETEHRLIARYAERIARIAEREPCPECREGGEETNVPCVSPRDVAR